MSKIFAKLLIVLGLISTISMIVVVPVMAAVEAKPALIAAQLLPLPNNSKYPDLPVPAQGTAQQQFYDLVSGVILNVRFILGALAIAIIVYAGVSMVVAGGNEDAYTKQRQNITWAIVGLALVGLSGEIVRIFQISCDVKILGQACTEGGFLKDPNAIIRTATLFDQRAQFVITFIKYIIGSIAVLMIVRSGIRMIVIGHLDDKMTLDKKNLIYGILGLMLIIMSDTFINKIVYKIDLKRYPTVGGAQPSFEPAQAIKELIGFTNLIVGIIAPLAVLALIYGGVLYVTSAGKEDLQGKAKRVIASAIVGILIMYGAFAIVSTFVGGSFEGGVGQVTQ